MDEFKLLTDMDDGDDILSDVDPQPIDVDRWELVLSPEEYLNRFIDSLADTQLISRAPVRKLHTTYHRGPAFDRYLLLAEAIHQLWVDLRYKDPFFRHLNRYHVAQPGTLELQASLGNVHLPTAVFIHCLMAAGCDTIRLKAYGQKMPMTEDFLRTEPARPTTVGPSTTNGTSSGPALLHHTSGSLPPPPADAMASSISPFSPWSALLRQDIPKAGPRHQVVQQSPTRRDPKNTARWRDGMGLGGFRIEVTVKAPSLREATRAVRRTGFLDPQYWLGFGEGPHAKHLISAKLFKRVAFLENANWVYQQATLGKVFHGQAGDKPSKQQVQALTDILNALG
ncbi:hypothetical protein EHS25_006236 [Saitozyma podzolica]|uniref:Uncharacterized protein n=1 Tax=Saitozyma podzolica TaxID=1890683 RepID=A0A427YR79_9TREE|nr:hypothetical protein EHS25_006236 [Saitozyma podzolica]